MDRRPSIHTLASGAVLVTCTVLVTILISDWWRGGRITATGAAARSAPARPARPPAPPPSRPISLAGAATKGDARAPVVILVYSEFQCPYCGRFARDTMPDLEREYIATGKVRFVFKHLPLERIHGSAVKAAEAVECAGAQGRFWEMHDALFKDQKTLDEASLVSRAVTVGLDSKAFRTCLNGTMTARVRRDLVEAEEFGIGGTPTFLVGTIEADGQMKATERFSGALPVAEFKTVIDRMLQANPR